MTETGCIHHWVLETYPTYKSNGSVFRAVCSKCSDRAEFPCDMLPADSLKPTLVSQFWAKMSRGKRIIE